MGNYTLFLDLGDLGNPRTEAGKQAKNFTKNVPKILHLKSSSEQIFSDNWRWVPLTLRFGNTTACALTTPFVRPCKLL